MINKKIIVCDLDGTLAPSKSELSPSMAETLCKILSKHYLAVISGGSFEQFQKQFLSKLPCGEEKLKNLYIFPTMGGTCYVYGDSNEWQQVYEERLTEEERKRIKAAMEDMIKESGMDFSEVYGDLIDDRGTQVTFSGMGQRAPLAIKAAWDKDQSKRKALVSILKRKIPDFEVRIGGATSIDVTKKGIDKAYAMEKIQSLLKIDDEEVIFIGDALFEGGNDAPVKITGVDYIQASNPEEAEGFLSQYL